MKKCPFCAEEIQAPARKCRHCGSDLSSGTGARPRDDAPVGAERGLVVTFLLAFVTCGIWGLVVLYQMGEELNRHLGREEVNPVLDVVLTVVTFGIWGIYLMYKYPKLLHDVTLAEEAPPVDLTVPCLLLAIFGFGIWSPVPVALLILQDALNKHWEAHRTLRDAGM